MGALAVAYGGQTIVYLVAYALQGMAYLAVYIGAVVQPGLIHHILYQLGYAVAHAAYFVYGIYGGWHMSYF
jgi:hypothetical protein